VKPPEISLSATDHQVAKTRLSRRMVILITIKAPQKLLSVKILSGYQKIAIAMTLEKKYLSLSGEDSSCG
jgi:hypothetical protein